MAFLTLVLAFSQRRAAQPIERRLRAAGELLDEVEAFDRDEQLVVAVIAQLEKLLDDVADADRELLQADELADAVVDVNDVVADLEVAQIREEGRGQRSLAAGRRPPPFLLEDVGLGVELQGRGRPAEAAWTGTLRRRAPRPRRVRRLARRGARESRSRAAVPPSARRGRACWRRTGSFRRDRAPVARRRSSRRYGRGTPAWAASRRAAPCRHRLRRWSSVASSSSATAPREPRFELVPRQHQLDRRPALAARRRLVGDALLEATRPPARSTFSTWPRTSSGSDRATRSAFDARR